MTRPVGVLDPAPPKGCSCVEPLTNPVHSVHPVHSVQFTTSPGRPSHSEKTFTWAPIWLNLAQLACLVLHVRPSCSTWLLLGSNLAHLCSNLVQLTANLVQLGPILAQLGSNLVQFRSQLGPTWSQNLTKKSFKKCFLASPSDLQFSIEF